MPINLSDNTRVASSKYQPSYQDIIEMNRKTREALLKENPEYMYDTQKAQDAQNMQDAANANFFGFAISPYQPQINPTTQKGQDAIKSNVDYTFSNVQRFAEQLAMHGVAEAINYLDAFKKIGEGAEQIVKSRISSPYVYKVGEVDAAENAIRNATPGAVKAKHLGTTRDGLNVYRQPKVKANVSPEKESKLLEKLDKLLKSKGWKQYISPEYDGLAYTKNGRVIMDLEGNIGETFLTRKPALFDHSNMPLSDFQLMFEKKGGKLNPHKFSILK